MKRTKQQALAELKRVWLTYFVDQEVYRITQGTYYCEKRNKELPGLLVFDKTKGLVDTAHERKQRFLETLITPKDRREYFDKMEERRDYINERLLYEPNDVIVEYKGRKGKLKELKGELVVIDCSRTGVNGIDKIEFITAHVELCKFKTDGVEIVLDLEPY